MKILLEFIHQVLSVPSHGLHLTHFRRSLYKPIIHGQVYVVQFAILTQVDVTTTLILLSHFKKVNYVHRKIK